MTITWENDTNVIVYALEKIISFARMNQFIILAQRLSWISSIIGLQSGLFIRINNLQTQIEAPFWEPDQINTNCRTRDISSTPLDLQEESRLCSAIRQTNNSEPSDMEISDTEHQDKDLQECEEFLTSSRRQR